MGKKLIIKGADFSAVAVDLYDINSIAYENLTFGEMFETNNLLGISPGFESGSFSPLTIGIGEPVLTDEVYDYGGYSLKSFSESSTYIVNNIRYSTTILLACRVRCDRYVSGLGGIVFRTTGATISETTGQKFVTTTAKITEEAEEGQLLYVGSCVAANMDVYVDLPVAIDINIFETIPDIETFTKLYNKYVNIKKNNWK